MMRAATQAAVVVMLVMVTALGTARAEEVACRPWERRCSPTLCAPVEFACPEGGTVATAAGEEPQCLDCPEGSTVATAVGEEPQCLESLGVLEYRLTVLKERIVFQLHQIEQWMLPDTSEAPSTTGYDWPYHTRRYSTSRRHTTQRPYHERVPIVSSTSSGRTGTSRPYGTHTTHRSYNYGTTRPASYLTTQVPERANQESDTSEVTPSVTQPYPSTYEDSGSGAIGTDDEDYYDYFAHSPSQDLCPSRCYSGRAMIRHSSKASFQSRCVPACYSIYKSSRSSSGSRVGAIGADDEEHSEGSGADAHEVTGSSLPSRLTTPQLLEATFSSPGLLETISASFTSTEAQPRSELTFVEYDIDYLNGTSGYEIDYLNGTSAYDIVDLNGTSEYDINYFNETSEYDIDYFNGTSEYDNFIANGTNEYKLDESINTEGPEYYELDDIK